MEKFTGYYARFGSRPDGFTDWAEFLKALTAVRQAVQSEAVSKPVGFPQWIIDVKKVPKRVVTVADVKSAYQYEINAPEDKPLKRPYTFKNGMAGTTMDLVAGTPKFTYNTAGYGGNIPASLRHEDTKRHAENRIPHSPVSRAGLVSRQSLPEERTSAW